MIESTSWRNAERLSAMMKMLMTIRMRQTPKYRGYRANISASPAKVHFQLKLTLSYKKGLINRNLTGIIIFPVQFLKKKLDWNMCTSISLQLVNFSCMLNKDPTPQ